MEAVRKIVDAKHLIPIIDLPENMQNRQVEIIVLPVAETEPVSEGASMKGFLKEYANPALAAQEKSAWERAVLNKHGNF